ncbi:MAG: 3-hydroxyacyl-CoA dehydrogenase [Alphaproteobacteria bacterium]|jgi:3-hydroxybutyryl-CoA dehydrogenase|nr:3-hydroxyacyl-CoA dehydrogenase [Alphaproteobacteria bacterium]MBT5918908.1 3-hydroxyacyl-CoA dehydrogenase [Alphaproteobacteria bacterium]MBT6387156.1 3-hydroxyacyl-CoA dehydrogenase [Alphaproteobacteria bacterium]
MSNLNAADLTIGVVGAGAMGRGIAQVSITGGMKALLFDAADGAAAKAEEFIHGMLDRSVDKGRMEAADAEAAKSRLSVVDTLEGLAPCNLVVEAIVENIAIKQEVFTALEKVVASDAIIASNTSSIRIASIAAACENKDRIAGLHFFNPVPLMRLVEVIRAPHTSDKTAETLIAIGKFMGRTPVIAKDGPGFLVNLGGRAYTTEAMRLLHEGVASPAQIDAVMRDCCNFRMGPLELADLTGIDVNFPVSQIIFNGYFGDQRLATSPVHEAMQAAGLLGRKTGAGFYTYDSDGTQGGGGEAADHTTNVPSAANVVMIEEDEELKELFVQAGAQVLTSDDGESPIVCAPIGEDCTSAAVRLNADHSRLVAVDILTPYDKRITIMTTPGADMAARDAVSARLAETGIKVTAINDSFGFIAPRIRAMIANLGCEMAQTGVAGPEDIDTAMTLGLNYPIGPLALTDAMGAEIVLALLDAFYGLTGDPRYRPSQWLRRRALLGISASTV